MKRLSRLLAVAAFSVAAAFAVDWKALQPQGYVSDFAGVVDASSRQALEQYCRVVESSTGAQIALVTVPTLEGEPVEDVANTLFRAWGVGKKGKDEGAMLLLVTGDRQSRLEIGYGLEPIIPDGFAGSILREMRPALRQSQYGEALKAAAQTLGTRIAEAKQVPLNAPLPRRVRPRPADSIPWPMLLGGLFALLWLLGLGGRGGPRGRYYGGGGGGLLPGLLMGAMLGRAGFPGRGGGGFGGFDSGDSFGGFGGGDSGGGGASSRW